MKRHTMEYLREQAHLRVRTNTFGAVARVRTPSPMAVHRFFHERDFYYIHTPHHHRQRLRGRGRDVPRLHARRGQLPASPTTGEPTTPGLLRPRGLPHRLGQLNVETYCQALSRVYTFGPTFRAENSNTSRHLAEFWMIEPEIAFADLADNATSPRTC
jgi:asparaginyl-tRNA synthetase